MFSLLQSARFIAALFVVLRHGSILFEEKQYFSFRLLGGLFRSGDAGVDFFFALSGFIILHAHWGDIGRPGAVLRFAQRRIIRIFPAYLVVLVPTAAAILALHGLPPDAHRLELELARNVLLLPNPDPLVAVAWTLQHEALFYLAFAALLLRLELGLAVFATWFIASGAISGPLEPFSPFLVNPHHIEFLIGMLCAVFMRTWTVPSPRLLLALGICGFAASCVLAGHVYVDRMDTDGPNLVLPLGLSSGLIIVGLVELERTQKLTAPAFARFLGDASYALYLVHFQILTACAQAIRATHLARHVPLTLLFAGGVVIAVAGGALFYRFVEQPLLTILKRRLTPGRRSGTALPAMHRARLG
jgi:peptidoglycan/LPS O-acetylase OafA/YrhL